MAEIDRPDWCPFPVECLCLSSYDSGACVGRMPLKHRHDQLFNTHRFCMQDSGDVVWWEINDADAYYFGRLMKAVRDDVRCNELYDPGRGDWYDIFQESK